MSQPCLNRLNRAFALEHIGHYKPSNVDSDKVKRIVHIGVGAFHRAHQAWYTHHAAHRSNENWCITGVSLRSRKVSNQLNPQNGLYTVIARSETGENREIISVIDKVLVAPDDPKSIIDIIAAPTTYIASLTITEKGYCHDPATGTLQLKHPDIEHDLNRHNAPKTAVGFLVKAIEQRLEKGYSPLSIMSCDNLPANGQLLKGLILTFAKQVSPALAVAIAQNYSFPCSMVDRIVPAVTDRDIEHFSAELGYMDQALVSTEQYSHWVIEDNFVNLKPDWAFANAVLVKDVHPYETMKLRLLNGSHSTIAYLGYLAGYKTVASAMQSGPLVQFVTQLMHNELLPTIDIDENVDLLAYCDQLRSRFTNPALQHQTYQIAMDGSQKLPQRLLAPLSLQIGEGRPHECLCFVIAAWLQYSSGETLEGERFVVQDPLADRLKEISDLNRKDLIQWVNAVFDIQEVFDSKLAKSDDVKSTVTHWLRTIRESKNMLTAINRLLDELGVSA